MNSHVASGSSPRIFLSHNSNDKPFVRTLSADLELNGCLPWVDENDMYGGDSLLLGISHGLQNTNYLLAIYSAKFAASNWAQQEISAAVAIQNSESRIKVLILRLDNTPLPALLQGDIYIDFRGSYGAGLNQLLRALRRPVTPRAPAPVGLAVDRARLVSVLNSLDPLSLTAVFNSIDGSGPHDNDKWRVPERVSALLAFVEGAVGPSLNRVAEIVTTLFPNTKDKIGPFR